MITLDSKIQKGEKEKEMKNKKLWIFGGIILLIVILNHIFDWSSYISTAENLEFMKRIVQNNLPLAILLYMVLTFFLERQYWTSGCKKPYLEKMVV